MISHGFKKKSRFRLANDSRDHTRENIEICKGSSNSQFACNAMPTRKITALHITAYISDTTYNMVMQLLKDTKVKDGHFHGTA